MILREADSYSTQIWIGVALVGGAMALIGFLSPHVKLSRSPMGQEDIAYSYEMPRGEYEDAPFDLSSRDVRRERRELEALVAKQKAKAAALVAPTGAGLVAGTGAKKSTTTVTPTTAAAAAAKMAVSAVGESDRYKMKSGTSFEATNSQAMMGYQYYPKQPTAQSPAPKKEEEETVLTAAQWRTLLQSQPTATTISKFLKARSLGQVDEASLLEILRDLLKDSAEERRNAALKILDQSASPKIFEFLIVGKTEFAMDLQVEMQKRTGSYSTPARIMYLGPVLATSEDKVVISAALEQLSLALEVYKKSRGENISQALNPVSLQQLQIFTGTLQLVGSNADSQVAEQALALNQDIRSLSPPTPQLLGGEGETQTAKIDDF